MLSKTAQIPGPTPANRLVTRTAAKNSTNGAPVPVKGTSHILRANILPTMAMAKRYRNMVFWNMLANPVVANATPELTTPYFCFS
jgi:hypothetical protein